MSVTYNGYLGQPIGSSTWQSLTWNQLPDSLRPVVNWSHTSSRARNSPNTERPLDEDTDGSLSCVSPVTEHKTRLMGKTASPTFVDVLLLFCCFGFFLTSLHYHIRQMAGVMATRLSQDHTLVVAEPAECLGRDILAAVQHNSSRALIEGWDAHLNDQVMLELQVVIYTVHH